MYFLKVMTRLYNPTRFVRPRFRHFEAIEGEFYNHVSNYRVTSTNGFAIHLPSLNGDFRISRFVRDPRDLIVSGYFYHLRGAEPWFRFSNPSNKYWEPINGHTPVNMPSGVSYSEYLQGLSKEQGLLAEMEFRKNHLQSMREWPEDDPRIRVFRYEEILGNERQTFEDLLRFYEVTPMEIRAGGWMAQRYALKSGRTGKHVRNPAPGQWREHFSKAVIDHFSEQYGDLLDRLKYH